MEPEIFTSLQRNRHPEAFELLHGLEGNLEIRLWGCTKCHRLETPKPLKSFPAPVLSDTILIQIKAELRHPVILAQIHQN